MGSCHRDMAPKTFLTLEVQILITSKKKGSITLLYRVIYNKDCGSIMWGANDK